MDIALDPEVNLNPPAEPAPAPVVEQQLDPGHALALVSFKEQEPVVTVAPEPVLELAPSDALALESALVPFSPWKPSWVSPRATEPRSSEEQPALVLIGPDPRKELFFITQVVSGCAGLGRVVPAFLLASGDGEAAFLGSEPLCLSESQLHHCKPCD